MANPNAAMASATLVRRGKERMDGKKKKRATKLRKIILISRANKKKFKEEKMILEGDKRRLHKEVGDYQTKLESAHSRFFELKKEVEESPLSVLR